VDLGFSAAKFVCGDKKGMVKSCFRKTRDGEGFSFGGDNYLIGERALLQTGSHFLRTTEELIAYYPLFVGVASEKSRIDHGDNLAVGLPFDCWKAESSKQKRGACNAIDGLTASLKLISFNRKELSFERVLVYPQGLGGIKTYLATGENTGGNILAIDIGFNTVISTIYSQAENEILAGRTFYKKGLHDMAVNLLMPDIASHIGGKTLTPLEVNYLVETGHIQVGFDLIDIRPEINVAANTYIQDLLTMIIGDLKAHGGVITFETILLFGGGARLLDGKLEATKVKIVTLPEPEYANARGFQIKTNEIMGVQMHEAGLE
jgi:plasmid segregation protein ParM